VGVNLWYYLQQIPESKRCTRRFVIPRQRLTMATGGAPGGSVSLGSLPIEQLEKLETGMSNEVEMLQKQMAMLTDGVQRLQASKEGSEAVDSMMKGSEIMVPLTGSIYVPGTIADTSSVLVDIGTGYYVEKKPAEAAEYFARRTAVLKNEGEKTASALTEKRQHLEAVSNVLARKKAMLQREQQAAAEKASS
jgi:prefoldin alpha subunit